MSKLIKKETLIIFLGSVLIAAIFCLPYLNGYIKVGSDTTFHMNRIEAIKESIENGILYPYIYTEQNYGFGYGTAAFYGQLFLYPAVLLRMFGLSIYQTWIIYIFLIIFTISVSVAYCTKNITGFKNTYWLLFASLLCVFNTFLISRTLQRAALGELLALIFIPLIISQTHNLLYFNKNNWIKLGLSFSCLLMSHNISFILMVIVFGVTLLFNIKKVIINKLYIIIIKALIFAILLSLFFLLPMLEQMSVGIYNINNSVSKKTYIYGVEFIQYLDFYVIPFGVKLAINLTLIVLPFIVFFSKRKDLFYLSITGILLLILSSKLFPWEYLNILSFIQFPSRLITIALPYLSISSVVALNYVVNKRNKILIIVCCVCLFESLLATTISIINIYKDFGAISKNTTTYNLKTGETLYKDKDIHFSYNIPETSGNEYLPYGFYGDYYAKSLVPQIISSDQIVDILYKKYNEQNYKLTVKDDSNFIFPKTYYKGYIVNIYKDGEYIETLQTKPDNRYNSFVSVTLDDSYKGKEIQLQLIYKNTKIQKISIAISLLTFICSVCYLIYKKKKST